MKFKCNNITCRIENKMGSTYTFRFQAKPTIDERTQCPKCGFWCYKTGFSPKDLHIRKIDIMFSKLTKIPLTENQYIELIKLKTVELKDTVLEIDLGLEVLTCK